VKELDWPAQNLELNFIEHLWDELEQTAIQKPSLIFTACPY